MRVRARALRVLAAVGLLTVLAGCENSATSYMIDGSQHALILVREQKFVWDDELRQAVVVSRLPACQKRIRIHPGSTVLVEMKIYEAGDSLWALHQGSRCAPRRAWRKVRAPQSRMPANGRAP